MFARVLLAPARIAGCNGSDYDFRVTLGGVDDRGHRDPRGTQQPQTEWRVHLVNHRRVRHLQSTQSAHNNSFKWRGTRTSIWRRIKEYASMSSEGAATAWAKFEARTANYGQMLAENAEGLRR